MIYELSNFRYSGKPKNLMVVYMQGLLIVTYIVQRIPRTLIFVAVYTPLTDVFYSFVQISMRVLLLIFCRCSINLQVIKATEAAINC